MMTIEYADNPTLLSDGMIECAICQQSISVGCGYRNSDAGTVHDMESDCAANLAFVFDALEKAESQFATARQDAFAAVLFEREECAKACEAMGWIEDVEYAKLIRARSDVVITNAPEQPAAPPLSTEAQQGCECENCRDERRC